MAKKVHLFAKALALEPALRVELYIQDGHIQRVFLHLPQKDEKAEFSCRIWSEIPDPDLQDQICQFLEAYSEGKTEDCHLPLNLDNCPTFTQDVLGALNRIPFGKTRTYGAIAEAVHNPKAYRAVGHACHRNPFPLIIPCHRVVAKGSLGGFALPMEIKTCLLDFEKSFALVG